MVDFNFRLFLEIFHENSRFLAWKMQAKFELLNRYVSNRSSSIFINVSGCSFQNIYGLVCDTWPFLRYLDICGYLKHFRDENFD